jgi:hypothetical protein
MAGAFRVSRSARRFGHVDRADRLRHRLAPPDEHPRLARLGHDLPGRVRPLPARPAAPRVGPDPANWSGLSATPSGILNPGGGARPHHPVAPRPRAGARPVRRRGAGRRRLAVKVRREGAAIRPGPLLGCRARHPVRSLSLRGGSRWRGSPRATSRSRAGRRRRIPPGTRPRCRRPARPCARGSRVRPAPGPPPSACAG